MPDFKNFIRFTDCFNIVLDQEQEETKKRQDFLHLLFPTQSRRYRAKPEDDFNTPQVLGVRIAATHSGKVTDNNGIYLPDKMKTGTSSWLEPFPKPILLHHEKTDDAIGRVKNAKYVDISEGFRRDEGWLKRADHIVGDYPSDRLIDAFIAGELSPRDSVDVVRNVLLVKDFNYTKNPAYPGLGYIELAATISDPDAIRKVRDERFLTGSIGARSDAAVCSVCKKDWVKGEDCEHRPGREYDGVLCVVIAGNLLYDEYSYVNRPADQQSRNLEIFTDGELRDSISTEARGSNDRVPEVFYTFDDSLTEFSKPEKDESMDKETWLKLLDFVECPENITLESIVDGLLAEPSDLVKELNEKKPESFDDEQKSALSKAIERMVAKLATPEEKDEVEQTEQEKLLDALKADLGEEDYNDLLGEDPDDSDILYAQQVADAKMNRVEEMTEEERQAFLDAKLSSKTRKGLASSTFCGPNRSFPVNDCAHVTAARRLIGKYKGPGNKSSILACVARKAKRLGCDGAKKKDAIGDFVPEYFDTFDDEQVVQMLNGLNKVLAEREIECDTCEEIKNDIDTLRQENAELKDQLKAASTPDLEPLKKELSDAYADLEQAKAQLVALQEQNRNVRASHIVAFQVLAGEAIENVDAKVAELLTKTDDELTALEDEVRDSINVEQLNAMLNNGLANNPQGGVVVENPGLGYTLEDGTQQQDETQTTKITKDEMNMIAQEYLALRCTKGAQVADMFLDDLKEKGIIPKEMPKPKQ